jgi:hypothetical protein
MSQFNGLVQNLSESAGFKVVDVASPSFPLMFSSFDNVHLCPQCCGGSDVRYTQSLWKLERNLEKAHAELLGCHGKVNELVNALLT